LSLEFVRADSNFRYGSLWRRFSLSELHHIAFTSASVHVISFSENNRVYFFTKREKCFVCYGVLAPETSDG